VAVYSVHTEALSLAEVEVYEQDCKLYSLLLTARLGSGDYDRAFLFLKIEFM